MRRRVELREDGGKRRHLIWLPMDGKGSEVTAAGKEELASGHGPKSYGVPMDAPLCGGRRWDGEEDGSDQTQWVGGEAAPRRRDSRGHGGGAQNEGLGCFSFFFLFLICG